jgi:hypothetical protein
VCTVGASSALHFVSACVVVVGERFSALNCVCSLSVAVVLDGSYLALYIFQRM